jgi:hypothetical protein
MISTILASCVMCSQCAENTDQTPIVVPAYEYRCYQELLTEYEREQIWMQLHFAIKNMNFYLEEADKEASRIGNVDIRSATRATIQGCICGLASRNLYATAIAGCLGALSDIAGHSYDHFVRAKDLVFEAETYARIADDLQYQLWMD